MLLAQVTTGRGSNAATVDERTGKVSPFRLIAGATPRAPP